MKHRLLLVVAFCCTTMTWTLGALINDPQPMTVDAPVGAMVTFTCVVNTTELPAGTKLVSIGTDGVISWIVNGMVLEGSSQSVTENGTLLIGTHQLPVIQDYITSVTVQCRIIVEGSFSVFRSKNATLTAYGEISAALCVFEVCHFLQVHLRHHQTSHQHSPVAML